LGTFVPRLETRTSSPVLRPFFFFFGREPYSESESESFEGRAAAGEGVKGEGHEVVSVPLGRGTVDDMRFFFGARFFVA
jgi:hypothetical protein